MRWVFKYLLALLPVGLFLYFMVAAGNAGAAPFTYEDVLTSDTSVLGTDFEQEFKFDSNTTITNFWVATNRTSSCYTNSALACGIAVYVGAANIRTFDRVSTSSYFGQYLIEYQPTGGGTWNATSTNNYRFRAYTGYDANSLIVAKIPSTTYDSTFDRFCRTSAVNGCGTPTTLYDADMWLFFNSTFSLTTSTIRFLDTPTSTCNFANWSVRNFVPEDTVTEANLNWSQQVVYGLGSDSYTWQDNYGVFVANTQAPGFPKSNTYPGAQLLQGYSYYARAQICSSNNPESCVGSNIIAQSDEWNFIVADPALCGNKTVSLPGFKIPFSTSTNSGDNFTCDSASGFFANSLCNLMQWLFIPDNSSLQQFATIKEQLQSKPPFGYFGVYSTAISGLSSATSTTSTLNGQNTQFDEQLTIAATNPIIDFVDTYILTPGLWLLFVLYLYKRFKNFSFNG